MRRIKENKTVLLLSLFSSFLTYFLLWVSKHTFPYKGFFPYKEVALQYSRTFFSKAANFDGVHYLRIAKEGYAQYEQAFFPLYPLLIRVFSKVFFGNFLYAGIFLSNFFFILGILIFYLVLKKEFGKNTALWSVLFIVFSPTSFYFNVVYTESLFLFLFSIGLYFLQRRKLLFSFLSFYFLGLTRVIGFLSSILSLPFKNLFVFIAPILGLFTYMIYLFKTTGDFLFFLHSQPAFGANRSDSLIFLPQVYFRYFKIFINTPLNFGFFTAVLEFFTFNVVFLVLLYYFWLLFNKKKEKLLDFSFEGSLLWFSLLSLLLPTFTGTFSSIPRYSLLSFSFFVFLGKYFEKNRVKILFLFLSLRVLLTLFFAQGYFVS